MFHYLADINTYSSKEAAPSRKRNFKTAKNKVCLGVLVFSNFR